MIPVSLMMKGFLSYQQEVSVDFSGIDLACITGSNGSGKSSLLDAMTWALFGQARRKDDALINSRASQAEVTFIFEYESHRYRIIRKKPRDKTGVLEFTVQNEAGSWVTLTEHSMRETEARIQETLRLDYETFTNASFFLQGKADQFSQQKPSDRKRILSSILGLEIWETYRARAAEQRKELEAELNTTDSRLAELEAEIRQEPQRVERLHQLETSLKLLVESRKSKEKALESQRQVAAVIQEQLRNVKVLEEQAAYASKRWTQLEQVWADRCREQSEYQSQISAADQIEAAYAAWQEAKARLEQWEKTAASFHEQEPARRAPLTEIETQRARLEQELRSLNQQQQQTAGLAAQLPGLQTQLDEWNLQSKTLTTRMDERARLESEIFQFQELRANLISENNRLKVEMNEIKERLEQLVAVNGVSCPVCGKPLEVNERDELLKNLQQDGTNRGNDHRQNVQEIKNLDAKITAHQQELNNLRHAESENRQLSGKIAALNERREQLQSTLNLWESIGLPRLAEVQACLADGRYALEARAELARVDAMLSGLGYDAGAHDAARRDEQNRRPSQEAMRQLEHARISLEQLNREVNSLSEQRNEARAEMEKRSQEAQAARAQYQVSEANLPDLEQAEEELNTIKEQESWNLREVGGARQDVDSLKKQKIWRDEFQASRAELTRKIARLKQLERAFSKDGVPAQLIADALPEIESQANLILDRLSNGNMSLNFNTQRDYKDRARDDKKETLDILINDALGSREYEMFSGGEAFRVNFAIRLALSRVLAQRAGARLQMLVIDEGFGSQDADGIQRLIEAINLVRQDFSKILVITHLESMKDAFPSRIEVEKNATGSTVKVVL